MAIPLESAYLCEDCSLIVELTTAGECPKCAGKGVVALARVLNRDAPAANAEAGSLEPAFPEGDWPESREFYELMQYYRHFPMRDPAGVLDAYEEVKDWLRRHRSKE